MRLRVKDATRSTLSHCSPLEPPNSRRPSSEIGTPVKRLNRSLAHETQGVLA